MSGLGRIALHVDSDYAYMAQAPHLQATKTQPFSVRLRLRTPPLLLYLPCFLATAGPRCVQSMYSCPSALSYLLCQANGKADSATVMAQPISLVHVHTTMTPTSDPTAIERVNWIGIV